MTSLEQLKMFSWISQASYLTFVGLPRGSTGPSLAAQLTNSSVGVGNLFAAQQAAAFSSSIDGLSFVDHHPNDIVGFSATVFKSNADTNAYTIVIRGTEPTLLQAPADLLLADGLGVALSGKAREQAIVAYRYYKQLTTAPGQSVVYSDTEKLLLGGLYTGSYSPLLTGAGYIAISALVANDEGLGDSSEPLIPSGAVVNFTGHSLGGHVAMLLAQLVVKSGIGNVGDVLTYNAPGFGGIQAEVLSWFGINWADSTIASKITNVYGEGGLNVAANLGFVPGTLRDIFIENGGSIAGNLLVANHSIVKLSDSLALYDLISRLDPALSATQIKAILKAGAANMPGSLENSLDALRKVFLGTAISPTMAPGAQENRESFYTNLNTLLANSGFQSVVGQNALAGRIIPLAGANASQLATQARDDFGRFFALYTLNTFAVVNVDAVYQQANGNLFSTWEQDRQAGSGVERNFSEMWLADRAVMLGWLTKFNTADGNVALRGNRIETYIFENKKSVAETDVSLTVVGRQALSINNPAKIIFGSEDGEMLIGTDVAVGDHLFGGGGDDTLIGNGGADYLEGGAGDDELQGEDGADILFGMQGDDILEGGLGNDTLDGGAGGDSYIHRNGDGVDTIVDRDGLGVIRVWTGPSTWSDARGGKKLAENLWESADTALKYTLNFEADGSQTLAINYTGGTLLVKDFVNEKLGINLEDAPPVTFNAPAGEREIRADLAKKVFVNPDMSAFPPGSFSSPITSTPSSSDYWVVDELGNFVRDLSQPLTESESNLFFWGSSGSDRMIASVFGNTMIANGGNDYLLGQTGVDHLGGGDGNDFIEGGAFADIPLEDWLSGSTPFPEGVVTGREDDVLGGGAGDDVIFGGLASDLESLLNPETPAAGHKGDWVSGMEGDDDLYGSTGDDLMLGGHGKDYIVGGPGNDVLSGDDFFFQSHSTFPAAAGSAWKVELGEDPFDVRFFPVSVTPLTNYSQTYYKLGGDDDVLFGGSGNDILIGMLGDDLLMGDDGNDALSGWEGDDRLFGGDGDDIMAGDFGRYEQPNDRLLGLSNSVPAGFLDLSTGDSGAVELVGNDYLDGGAGDDVLYGEAGNDVVLGGADDDRLWGDAPYLIAEFHGNDYLSGGEGDDEISGGGGDDVLIGGTGNDELEGSEGSDTYIFTRGDGRDSNADLGESGIDSLLIEGYTRGELMLQQRANGTIVLSGANGDEISIALSSENESFGIEQVRFSDGTMLDRRDLDVAPIDEGSVGGGDWSAFSEDDETIDASELPRNDGFVMVDAGGGDDVVHGVADALVYGGEGNDSLLGGYRLLGGSGDDYLADGAMLVGGEGDDRLINGSILIGGSGNDVLDGGAGADRYLIDPTEPGIDLILDSGGSRRSFLDAYYASLGIEDWESLLDVTETQYLVWNGEGPIFDNETDAREFFESRGSTLEEAVASGDLEIIAPLPPAPAADANDYTELEQYYFSGLIETDQVEFGPGIGLGDLAFSWSEILLSLEGGDGEVRPHSTLDISWGLGGLARVVIPRATDPIGSGVELFSFADDSLYSMADLIALAQPAPEFDPSSPIVGTDDPDILIGTSGNDEIEGGEGNDTLRGAGGRDVLLGGQGDDFYEFSPGDGVDVIFDPGGSDTILFGAGIASDMLTLGLGSLLIRVGDGGDEIHIEGFDPADVLGSGGIELFRFANGETLTFEQLIACGFDIYGTPADDVISGTDTADRIHGSIGNDAIYGGDGDDTYFYEPGDGHDRIEDAGGDDVVRFGEGIRADDLRVGRDAETLTIDIGDGQLALRWQPGDGYAIERFEFADGEILTGQDVYLQAAILGTPGADEISGTEDDDRVRGLAGDDDLSGEEGNDVLEGGEGNDRLSGGEGADVLDGGAGRDELEGDVGNDIYLFGRGYGHDFIYEEDETLGNADTIRFSAGIAPSDIAVTTDLRGSLHFIVDNGPDRLTVYDWLSGPELQVERIEFSDGTVWNVATVENRIVPAVASPYDDGLDGTEGDDAIAGLGGDDEIFDTSGNDILSGDEGNDYIEDADGRNYLAGGSGNDYMMVQGVSFVAGGAGNDEMEPAGDDNILAFNRGNGQDIAYFPPWYGIDRFTLSVGNNIEISDIAFTRESTDLVLDLGGGDSMRLAGWYFEAPGSQPYGVLQVIAGDIRTYGLSTAIAAFDAAYEAEPALGTWLARDALEDNLLSISLDEAIGGDIAYTYARQGNTDSLPILAIRNVLFDPGFGSSAQDVTLVEQPKNQPPVVAHPLPDQSAEEGSEFLFTIPANTFDDTNTNDGLTLSASQANGDPLPGWLDFDSVSGSFSGTPENDDVGIHAVRVTANDGAGLSTSDTFELIVENVNDDPIAQGDAASVSEDAILTVNGNVLANDSDVDAGTVLHVADADVYFGVYGTLTLAVDGGYSYALNNGAVAVQSLAAGEIVTDVFSYLATDGTADTLGILTMSLTGANDAPSLDSPIPDQSVDAGVQFSYILPVDSFGDVDQGDQLSYTATLASGDPLPAWLVFEPETRTFSGAPETADAGETTVRVTVTDSTGAKMADTFQLTVAAAPQGIRLEGTHGDDTLSGAEYDDILLGRSGDDRLYGLGGDDIVSGDRGDDRTYGADGDDSLYGGTGRDRLDGGSGDDVLNGGHGGDELRGDAGADLLAGSEGNDDLEGGLGDDLYFHERKGGHDVITETGGQDVLLFGEGVKAGKTRLYRNRDDLIVNLNGSDGRVTIKGWFASGSKRVESIQFADGTAWNADFIHNHLQRGSAPKPRYDDDGHEHGRDHNRDDHHGQSDNKNNADRDSHEPRNDRDRVADLLESYLAHKPRYDFEKLASDLERGGDRHEYALNALEIASRWQHVGHYVSGLSDERDDDARYGAGGWRGFDGLSLASGSSAGAFGHSGSTGGGYLIASLKTLKGLDEGFHQLRG